MRSSRRPVPTFTAAAALVALLAVVLPGCRAGADPAPAAEEEDRAADGGDPALAAWGRVLERYEKDGGVDYAALQRDRGDLDRFLRSLRAADPARMSKADRLAFWTNAYNAVVLHHVLERYPGIRSVRSVDGFFDELTFPVAGKERTLDEIEERGIEVGDPRIHFAVVCASTSCPDLRGEPYVGARLDAQLAEQTRRFLSDPSKGARLEGDTLHLSSIFKWYAGDFTGGSTVVAFFARGGVVDWVAEHAPEALARRIEQAEPSVRYLDYDWGLNDR